MADFSITCECGNTLSGDFYSLPGSRVVALEVERCDKCAEENSKKGYDEGFEDGEAAARDKYDAEMLTWADVKESMTA